MSSDPRSELTGPIIEVDIEKIEANARTVHSLCEDNGISLTAVTKVTCGMPRVARALIRAGVRELGESRLENIHRLRAGGITEPIMLLRIPPLSAAEEIVRSVDVSLNSELPVLQRLSDVALSLGTVHDVILMVDLGDLREGIWPDDLIHTVAEVREMEGVRIKGLGTNLTCYGGVIPSATNLGVLVDYAHRIEDRFGFGLDVISGGNSSSLNLLASGKMPKEINNLRIGEAILLGRETVNRSPWPGTSQRAFLISAELIEKKKKPSIPIGETGQDAFGFKPVFEDRGQIIRGILNMGREDVDVDGLKPSNPGIHILGASSDHLIIDMSSMDTPAEVGDRVEFVPNYSALLAAMTSEYVGKVSLQRDEPGTGEKRRISLIGSLFEDDKYGADLKSWLDRLGYEYQTETDIVADALMHSIRPGSIPVLGGRQYCDTGLDAAAGAMDQFGLLWVDSIITTDELIRVLGRRDSLRRSALSLDNMAIIGVREIEEEAAALIRKLNIRVYTMEDISLLPMREIIRQSIRRCSMGTQGLYLKFSGRVADNGNDGLTNRETHLIMELIAQSGTLRVIELDDDEMEDLSPGALESPYVRTSRGASANMPRFLLSALGKRILGV